MCLTSLSLPVPAGQIVTERDPAHWAGFEIWVGLAGITDNVSLSALEDFLRRPGQLQTDRALQQTVGRPGQSSGWRQGGRLAGLVLGEASVVLRQGVVHRLELSDGQLTPGVLGTPSRLQKIFR